MKLTVQTQLLPDASQARSLRETVERFNEACNWIATECFTRKEANQFNVRKFAYHEVRERFGLSSQMAQHAIKCVCDAYKRDKTRKVKVRKHAAIVYDQRTMSFKGIDRVSLLTLTGRVLYPSSWVSTRPSSSPIAKGQADLVLRHDGKWFLLVTVDVPEPHRSRPPTSWAWTSAWLTSRPPRTAIPSPVRRSTRPVDTTASAEPRWAGRRERSAGKARGPRTSARRRSGPERKEARFRKHENHCIAKKIVATAKGTDRGIGLEDLGGIRDRVSARGGDRAKSALGLGFLPAPQFHRVQGQTGRCARDRGRSQEHQPDLSRVRPLREGQPQEPERIRVSCVRASLSCGPRRGSEHRFPSQGVRNGT